MKIGLRKEFILFINYLGKFSWFEIKFAWECIISVK